MSYDLHATRPPTAAESASLERLAEAIAAVDAEFDCDDVIQVSLDSDEATISVPYVYEGEQAEAVMERMQRYAAVLTEVGGYTVWDPQTGEIVTGPGARHAYASGVDAVNRLIAASQKRRRWWQRRP